jgi:YYY domain-containing protein
LFDGRLGFHLVAEFTSPPGIFGIQFDDESAEEAFHVYDHPYVRIFKKGDDYSEKRVREILGSVDLSHVYKMWPKQVSAAPDALLLSDSRVQEQETSGSWSSMFHPDSLVNKAPVLAWLLLLELLGAIGFAILQATVELPDGGWGLSKALGWLAWSYIVWLGASTGAFPASMPELWVALIGLAALAAVIFVLSSGLRRLRENWKTILLEEVVFLAIFSFFLWTRWLNPDLWHPTRGGEKPMDFAFLNAVIKSRRFPPYDPWFSRGYVNYYYFGFVLAGLLTKLSGIVPAVAYNLSVPSFAALTGVGAFSVAFFLMPNWMNHGKKLLASLLAPAMLLFMGNLAEVSLVWNGLEKLSTAPKFKSMIPGLPQAGGAVSGFWAWLHGSQIPYPNDWWFWSATRVVKDTINEFPFFSYLFADLHAHVMALPFTLLALGLAVAMARSRKDLLRAGAAFVLLAFAVGALRPLNTWDYPTYLLMGIVGWALFVRKRKGLDYYGWLEVLWGAIGLVVLSTLLHLPFVRHYATAYAGVQLWRGRFTTLPEFLEVWGFFVIAITLVLWAEWSRLDREGDLPRIVVENASSLLAASAAIGLGMTLMGVQSWLFSLPILAAISLPLFDRKLSDERAFLLSMLTWGSVLLVGVELVRIKGDIGRMNTVFKFYLQVWVLWTVALAAYSPRVWREMRERLDPMLRKGTLALVVVFFLAGFLYPILATPARVEDRFDAHAPHTLDGEAYMKYARYSEKGKKFPLADDLKLILWMRKNIRGTPVVLEGRTPLYHWGSRISVYTGLPTPIGWDWHEKQQRSVIPSDVIAQRIREVQEMYETSDVVKFMELARYYRIKYVVVGDLERAIYPRQGLAKFGSYPKLFRKVYDDGNTKLFELVSP